LNTVLFRFILNFFVFLYFGNARKSENKMKINWQNTNCFSFLLEPSKQAAFTLTTVAMSVIA